MTVSAVETSALSKRFGSVRALDAVSLEVPEGTVFGLIGPNGAGKTTMLRLLVDILRPTSGTVRVLGEDPRAGGPPLRRRIGYLPGNLNLDRRVHGHDLLHHYARLSGPVRKGYIEQLAERLNLDLSRSVRALSKGNRQKLGLVQAFMHEPRLLVLDEPTSGLDPLVQQEFLRMVKEASANSQTVFLSSHVLSEIEQAADTAAILRSGHLVAVATVEHLRQTAIRHVRIGVAPDQEQQVRASLGQLSGLGPVSAEYEDSRVLLHATWEGDVNAFVRSIAGHHLLDLVVEEPDLEESVLRYYTGSEATGSETTEATRGKAS
ncbi:ABC transporter ATP-binding protein [Diaminobutyricimonas sp. LJ205]|uniref:ABC transporter ATP-binding protein n=1 Tax=Diaminobutyricimonas sp. LJ205 TaxID=2683590 RepID=UPI0012F5146C|nr:ABC transporter ATP-binding protein [Diaminobutyricimonas sp. LJ205]